MKPAQFAVLGFMALVAGAIIGLTEPTLVTGGYDSDGVTCNAAWEGGVANNATESGESDCAQIRSERFVWSITLALLGAGLFGCAIIAARHEDRGPVSFYAPFMPPPGPNDPPPPAGPHAPAPGGSTGTPGAQQPPGPPPVQ